MRPAGPSATTLAEAVADFMKAFSEETRARSRKNMDAPVELLAFDFEIQSRIEARQQQAQKEKEGGEPEPGPGPGRPPSAPPSPDEMDVVLDRKLLSQLLLVRDCMLVACEWLL